MDFKKKAGLALALAAIFTTGGANAAFAQCASDNTTCEIGAGETVQEPGKDLDASNVPPTAGEVDLSAGTQEGMTLTVDDTATEVKVSDLTLSGTGSGALIKGAALETVNVEAGGAVSLGSIKPDAPTSQGGTLGDLNFAGAADMAANVGSFTTGTITLATGALTLKVGDSAEGGALTVDGDVDLSLGTGSTIEVGTDAAGGTGTLIVTGELNQGDASIYLDPVWDASGDYGRVYIHEFTNDTITGDITVGEFSQMTIGATDKWLDTVVASFDRVGLWNSDSITLESTGSDYFSNALGLNQYTGITIDAAELTVDNGAGALDADSANGELTFAEDSAFVINAGKLYTNDWAVNGPNWATSLAAITGTAGDEAVSIDDDAKLVITNAKAGSTLTILDNVDLNTNPIGAIAWQDGTGYDNMLFDVNFLKGTLDAHGTGAGGALTGTGDTLDVVIDDVTAADVRNAFPKLSGGMASMIADIYDSRANNTDDFVMMDDRDKDSAGAHANGVADDDNVLGGDGVLDDLVRNNAGIQFVSRAVSNTYGSFNGVDDGAAILEGAAQIAVVGGVPYLTNNVITRISDMIVDRNNFLNDTQPAYGNEPGQFGLWVTPFYSMSDVDGMDAGRLQNGFELNYGGAAFGMDYNVNEAFRLGMALNLGSGDTDSDDGDSDFNRTENDFDFFGGSIYGSWTNGAFGLTGDLGYTTFDSEITQALPASMGMGSSLKTNVDSDAFTVGLTGKYRFNVSDNLGIAPHLGLRYTKISIDDADVDLADGRRIFDVDTEDQNLFQIPLGVEFSSQFITDGGWTVKPKADLGVLFTTGDTDVDSRARLNTGSAYGAFNTGTMNAEVVDEAAFTGALGITAAADNGLSLGLDYGILASGNQTDHQFSGMLRFEF